MPYLHVLSPFHRIGIRFSSDPMAASLEKRQNDIPQDAQLVAAILNARINRVRESSRSGIRTPSRKFNRTTPISSSDACLI